MGLWVNKRETWLDDVVIADEVVGICTCHTAILFFIPPFLAVVGWERYGSLVIIFTVKEVILVEEYVCIAKDNIVIGPCIILLRHLGDVE